VAAIVSKSHPGPDPSEWADPVPTYDAVAADYVEEFLGELSRKPFDRELLDRFASVTGSRANDQIPVCDLGCGPGHIGAYVAAQGVPVVGIDLTPAMVTEARRCFPQLAFHQGDMTALDWPNASFSGIVCFYALIHIPRAQVLHALAEMHRTLVERGDLLLAVHGGTGSLHAVEMLGHEVSLDATLFSLDELTGLVETAGFAVVEAHERKPYADEHPTQRLYVWARRHP
jgi:SAM-dependent methyltransferase